MFAPGSIYFNGIPAAASAVIGARNGLSIDANGYAVLGDNNLVDAKLLSNRFINTDSNILFFLDTANAGFSLALQSSQARLELQADSTVSPVAPNFFLQDNAGGGVGYVLIAKSPRAVENFINAGFDIPVYIQRATVTTGNAIPQVVFSYATIANTMQLLEIKIISFLSDFSAGAVYEKIVGVRNAGAGAVIIGAVQDVFPPQIDAALAATVLAVGVSGNDVTVTVTGLAATNITWSVSARVLSSEGV